VTTGRIARTRTERGRGARPVGGVGRRRRRDLSTVPTAAGLGPHPAPLRLCRGGGVATGRRGDSGRRWREDSSTFRRDGGRTPPPPGTCRSGDGVRLWRARLWRKGFSIGELLAQLSTVGQAGTHMTVMATRRKQRGRAKLSTAWHTRVKNEYG
jgi:hypothetical protein